MRLSDKLLEIDKDVYYLSELGMVLGLFRKIIGEYESVLTVE